MLSPASSSLTRLSLSGISVFDSMDDEFGSPPRNGGSPRSPRHHQKNSMSITKKCRRKSHEKSNNTPSTNRTPSSAGRVTSPWKNSLDAEPPQFRPVYTRKETRFHAQRYGEVPTWCEPPPDRCVISLVELGECGGNNVEVNQESCHLHASSSSHSSTLMEVDMVDELASLSEDDEGSDDSFDRKTSESRFRRKKRSCGNTPFNRSHNAEFSRKTKRWKLAKRHQTIGSDASCDVVLPSLAGCHAAVCYHRSGQPYLCFFEPGELLDQGLGPGWVGGGERYEEIETLPQKMRLGDSLYYKQLEVNESQSIIFLQH